MRNLYIVTDIHDNPFGLGQQNKLEDLLNEYAKPLSAKLTRKRDATFTSKINRTLEEDEF